MEYELGRAIPNQQIVAKLERTLGMSPGLPHLLLTVCLPLLQVSTFGVRRQGSPRCLGGGVVGSRDQHDCISSQGGVQVGNDPCVLEGLMVGVFTGCE